MVPSHPRRSRFLRSTVLALVLTIGTVAIAVARDDTAGDPLTHGSVGGTFTAAAQTAIARLALTSITSTTDGPAFDGMVRPVAPAAARPAMVAPRPRPATFRAAPKPRDAKPAGTAYRGRNHVWMPSLRIDRSISFYSCSNQSYPGNRVYRWGCAGSNNVYLFGHASSVFKPLHDAYVGGRLRKGAVLYYADGAGKVHTYRVSWWKLTTATKGTWAYQPQSRSSLTLQTCIGAQNQYRLIVRLTEV